jgi:hypothetical protein
MKTIKAYAIGALRSWTVWFSALLMALPDILPVVQANFPTFAPFIPDAMESRVMNVIALGILLLRLKTTTCLSQKAQQPPDTHDDGTAASGDESEFGR